MELFENIEPVNIEDEIKVSYLDYAMSVIIGRALPDARDGLKPVHRRILYTMRELGNDYNKPYKKSARVVGDVMGKYHPHGDQSIYDALARMAQDFSMRYLLADGQGNFGSIDGDPPAAMRYTEVRMTKLAHEFLADIEKETVDFTPNYDGSLNEPAVLPSRVPGLLINGSSGIAVGMATNVPPHNMAEICEALIALIENPAITIDQLIEKVPGPDFPSAGFILGRTGIREAYHTGRGIIRLRARASVETGSKDKKSLIITELPYQVNKAKLLESIDELIREKKIEGLGDIRDESDREGMRMVLEIKSSHRELAEIILNQLYRLTQMEISFGINMLAIVGQAPRLLTLKDVLVNFLDHRKDVVVRRTRFELAKAEARAHILEGLRKALEQLDLVISLIRNSRNPQEAKQGLITKLTLSERQAQAILDLRLQKLTRLERRGIDDEYIELMKTIAHLRDILGSERLVYQVIQEELLALKEEYGDERRTQILAQAGGDFVPEDLIADEDMVVTISHGGYIKRNPVSLYRSQRRGGRGVTAARTKEDDFVSSLYVASAHSYLLFLTVRGRLLWLKVHEVPQGGRISRGKALVNVLPLSDGEKVATVLPVKNLAESGRYVVMATRNGTVKRVKLDAFANPRKNGLIALTVGEADELVGAALTDGRGTLILSTKAGKAICFEESEVRAMGRQAAGVRGIALAAGDRVVSLETLSPERTEILLSVTENGYGKRTLASEYRPQARGGMGLITIKTTARNGQVVGVLKVTDDDRVMLITDTGRIILFKVGEVSLVHRNTQGVKLIEVAPQERVVDVAPAGEGPDEGPDLEAETEEP